MGHFKRFRYFAAVMAVGILGLVFLMPGCSDDPPPVYKDTFEDKKGVGSGEGGTKNDGNKPNPDIPGTPDQPVWPDIWPDTSKTPDWYQPPDWYSGSPFGCQTNADCFGQKCCPTPWGVKLCAPTCVK